MQAVLLGQSLPVRPDSAHTTPNWKPVYKAAIVPGWGQVNQERLAEGLFFYFSSATYYYRSVYHLYQYNTDGGKRHRDMFRLNLAAALFLHGLNVLDAADVVWKGTDSGWKGSLFSDLPVKSPLGAATRSAMLPGWGQVYNHAYWKAAGYFAVNSYLMYRIIHADARYKETNKASYKSERSDYSWLFGLSYLITITDAYAGAYLFRFDEAMELTVVPAVTEDQLGIGLYVRF